MLHELSLAASYLVARHGVFVEGEILCWRCQYKNGARLPKQVGGNPKFNALRTMGRSFVLGVT